MATTIISPTALEEALRVSRRLLEESATQPAWFNVHAESLINFFIQPALLSRDDLLGDFLPRTLDFLLDLAVKRRGISAKLSQNLYAFWSQKEGRRSLRSLQSYFMRLVHFGPVREELEDRLAESLTLDNHRNDSLGDRSYAVQRLTLGSDYLARVRMNSLLHHIDPADESDRTFALSVFDDLLDMAMAPKISP
jgi:hypothetical protein